MQIFEDLNKAIKERYEMIERAVETERKSQHMSRAFTDRMDELVEARTQEASEEEEEATKLDEATASVEVVEAEEVAEEAAEEVAEEAAEESESEEAPAEDWGDESDPWSDQ